MADGGDEIIRYVLRNEGVDATAAGFKKVAAAIGDSAKAQDQLSQQLKSQARINEVMQRSAERAAVAQKAALAGIADAATKSSGAFAGLAQGAQRTTQTLGAFGLAANGLIPGMEGMGAAVGRATGVIGGMTSLLGGPWGIAIGLATAALGAYTLQTKEAAEQTRELAKAQEEEAQAAHEARLRRMEDAAGLSTYAKAMQAVADMRARVALQNMGEEDPELKKRALEAMAAQEQAAFGGSTKDPNAKRGARIDRVAEMDARENARSESVSLLTRVGPSPDVFRRAPKDFRAGNEATFSSLKSSMKSGLGDDLAAANKSAFGEELKQWDERNKLAKEHHEMLVDGAHEAWGMVGGAAAGAFSALAKGQKVSTKALLAGIGEQMIAAGTMKLFEGAFQLLMLNPAGAGMAGIGAAELAAGMALTGAGGSGGGAGGSGAGGGGAAPMPYAPTFAKPSHDSGAKNLQAQVIYTVHATVAPTEHDGQRVRRAQEEAARHGL